MNSLYTLIQQHPAIAALASYWLVSAAISAMPRPTANSSQGYAWFYTFSHLILGNLDKLIQSKGGVVAVETVKPTPPDPKV